MPVLTLHPQNENSLRVYYLSDRDGHNNSIHMVLVLRKEKVS